MNKKYTGEKRAKLVEQILELIPKTTTPLACKKIGVPVSTFRDWIGADEVLAARYAQARTLYMDMLADEILSISDEEVGTTLQGGTDTGAVQHARLRVDSRKWLLSKLAFKKYGDRLALTGDEENPLVITKVERKVIDTEQSEDCDG